MKKKIVIPVMGESITDVIIGRIIKQAGSFIQKDEEIIELETEKVNQVLYAQDSGLLTLTVSEGEKVKVGEAIGEIETQVNQSQISQKVETKKPKKIMANEEVRKGSKEFLAEFSKKEEGKFIEDNEKKEKENTDSSTNRQKMTAIRKVIADRMVRSLRESAMLTTFNEADMSAIANLREKYKEDFLQKHQVKMGLMPFFVLATIEALKEFPALNAFIEKDELVFHKNYHIGIAVGTDKGLVVPVIKNSERLSFVEIEKTIKNFSEKAKNGRLSIEDMQGGTFTITNGGVYGSLLSTPILNPPQSGILGMHQIQKRAVIIEDQIVIRPMMYLALSYDHRIVDGKEAVSFLVKVKQIVEDPARLLL